MLTNDKIIQNNVIISVIQISIGAFLLFIGSAGIMGCFIDEEGFDFYLFLFILFWTISFAWLLCCGIKRFRMVKVIKRYKNLIGDVPCASFRELAPLLGESEGKVQRNFEWMIDKYFFEDACINYEEKSIYFDAAYQRAITERKWIPNTKREKVLKVSEYCECCGAINMIELGGGGLCEYCRAPIGKDKEYIDREGLKNEVE